MQELIVTLIVACAAFTIARRYLPKAARHHARRWFARAAEKAGMPEMARKFQKEPQALASCDDGCNTCGACDSTGTPSAAARFTITPEALKRTIAR